MTYRVVYRGEVIADDIPTSKRAVRAAIALLGERQVVPRVARFIWTPDGELLICDDDSTYSTGFQVTANR